MDDLTENNLIRFTNVSRKKDAIFANFKVKGLRKGVNFSANIQVDMIVQNVAADQSTDFTFTVGRHDYELAFKTLSKVAEEIDAREVSGDNKIAKLSMVGVGMRSHAGVASKMFQVLADESINIQMISTSESKISVVIAEKYLELAARALHSAFDMAEPTK